MRLLIGRDYQSGDQAPEGYLAWHEWAEVQHKAGLRQVQCGRCARWKYPQELSGEDDRTPTMTTRGKRRIVSTPVCNACFLASEPKP